MSFRHEEKLRISSGKLHDLLLWINENNGKEIYKTRLVSSTYFDNDNMCLYRESEEGSTPRKKIRIRSYSRSPHTQDNSFLEIKTSSVEGRFKTTSKNFNLNQILSMGYFDSDYGICKPIVRITYRRTYFKIFDVRLTIDRNIEYQMVNGKRLSPHKFKDPDVAVEIKADNLVPNEYLLRKFPFERIRFSKYSNAINKLLKSGVLGY